MQDDIPKAVGSRVRRAMEQARVTQAQVAQELDISQSQISRRLRGEIAFNVIELDVVARLCGISAASLMEEVAA